jgi:soluble lytic murein transglycosylase-like protein
LSALYRPLVDFGEVLAYTEGMKPWLRATAAALVLAAPAAAQSPAGVSVWLQLPMNAKFAAPGQAHDANALIFKLLGPDSDSVTIVAQDGPLVHYESPAWSPLVAEEERRAALSALSAHWGSALRIEEGSTGASVLASGPVAPPAGLKGPTLDSGLGLMPTSLLAGNHSGFYDGAKPVAGSGGVVSAGPGAGFSRLAPAKPMIAFSPLKPAPPAPPAGPYADQIERAARASGIDPALLRAVVVAKSRYRSDRAYAGAYGLMGVSARNAKAYGYTARQILDPETNLKVGSDMLADLLKQFGGDVNRALAAYQAGPRKVLDSDGIPNDRDVRDFMNSVQLALGPQARAASIPVKTIRSPLKYGVQKDLIELAEQARKGTGVSRYRPLIEKAAAQFDVDPRLMEAMVMQEDPSGNPDAVSPKGAQGLTQLMPPTAAALGVKNPFDPVESLRGMARHIKHLSRIFNGDQVLIAASYNAGEGSVERAGRVPRFKETMAYVRRVFNNYDKLTDKKIDVEPYMPPSRRVAAR